MSINKQSNLYTTIYIIVLVLIVGSALALTSLSLRDRQQANINADKMRQILASVHIAPDKDNTISDFNKYVTRSFIVNSDGVEIPGDAFTVNVSEEAKLPEAKRLLPVYECKLEDGSIKYILPMYGAGLWGPIWGYVAFDSNGTTIYGAYFAHQGETPGLGAEIEKPAFSDQFNGKSVMPHGEFLPIEVVKKGQKPAGEEDYVDGISGGTITSKGVGAMFANCITPYKTFLSNLSNQ